MSEKVSTRFVSLYTVPWSLDSITLFKECWIYFWWDLPSSKFHKEDMLNCEYIWIGEELDPLQKNAYMQVSFIWRLCPDISDYKGSNDNPKTWSKAYHIKNHYSFWIEINDECIRIIEESSLIPDVISAFMKHIASFHQIGTTNKYKSNTPTKWHCIRVEKNTILQTLEWIEYYPSKSIVPFPINLGSDMLTYIPSKILIDEIHLFWNCFLIRRNRTIHNRDNNKTVSIWWETYWYAISNILSYISLHEKKEFTIHVWINDWVLWWADPQDFQKTLSRAIQSTDSWYKISYSKSSKPTIAHIFRIIN
jgi:hypothetical protein